MNYETKRDVFEKFADECAGLNDEIYNQYMQRYDTALPDDMPVIPKVVSEWLTWLKSSNHSLKDVLDGETRVSEDTFARAWLLGAWTVKETGEIVKLEAEE